MESLWASMGSSGGLVGRPLILWVSSWGLLSAPRDHLEAIFNGLTRISPKCLTTQNGQFGRQDDGHMGRR